jgi:hypothetical protein
VTDIDVRCDVIIDGWQCRVRVADETGASDYDVGIGELGSFLLSILPYPSFEDMDRLVRETFEFLLEREPRTAILSRFDLRDVSRYFPEYPATIRVRLSR